MIKLKRICESKQVGTLYHVCPSVSLIYNLKNNSIKPGLTANRVDGKPTISFTRNKKYFVDNIRTDFIVYQLVLDGDLISENKKIRPYAAKGYRNTDIQGRLEQEEIIYGELKNLKKYLKEINIFILKSNYDAVNGKIRPTTLMKSIEALGIIEKSGIPAHVGFIESADNPINVSMGIPNTLSGLSDFLHNLLESMRPK